MVGGGNSERCSLLVLWRRFMSRMVDIDFIPTIMIIFVADSYDDG